MLGYAPTNYFMNDDLSERMIFDSRDVCHLMLLE